MATRNGLWRERFPGGLAAAAGAVSPRAPLAELVSRTTQPRRGGDPGELFRRHLSGLSGQSALYQAGEAQREDFDALASAHPRGARAPPSRTSHFSLSSLAMACGQASKARFPKGFAVMGCAGRAIVVSQRRSCKPRPSRQPST